MIILITDIHLLRRIHSQKITPTTATSTTPPKIEERNEREPPVRERAAVTDRPEEELTAEEAEITEDVSHK